jgi:predicted Zn-dependent protease
MRRFPLFLACCAPFALSGCGGAGDPPVSASERELGAEQHPLLLAEFGGAYDGDEAAYLKRLGEKIATQASLEEQCTFTLVNTHVVNAFAVPGCYIYVTRGLMGIVNSEAELASVLAHEVGHITGNHSERQQRRSLFRGLGVAAIGVITGSERLTQIAGAAAGLFTLRYSRKHEYEADDLGLGYLSKAGYDPHAAVDMLDALGRHQQFLNEGQGRDEANRIPEWAMTHPLTGNRVARARQAALTLGVQPGELPENEQAYLRELDALLYGDDPQQGFVLGRRFAHPVMRVAFEAPPGFTLANSPRAVSIQGPDGVLGEFAGGRMPPGGLRVYAESTLGALLKGAEVRTGLAEETRINGVPAILVPASVRTQQGDVAVSFAAFAGSEGAYHFFMVSPPGAPAADGLGALFGSFRLLSGAEASQLRARRIRTVQAGAGDTLRSLSQRMATDRPFGHFLMLNGRTEQDSIRPGELVKLVVLSER